MLKSSTRRVDRSTKKKICIIGAGAAGLTSARHVAQYPDEFELVVFEKNSFVGGVWQYTDQIGVDEHNLPIQSSMYKNLRYLFYF